VNFEQDYALCTRLICAVNLRDFGAKNFSGIFCDRRGAGENSWDGIGRECGLGAHENNQILPGKFS
jgi:hypothetical protein